MTTALAVLTSGGDAPGMNAAIRAVTKVSASLGVAVWGVEMGFDGLIDGEFRPLTRQSGRNRSLTPTAEVEAMGSLGGTALGSSRCSRFFTREGRAEAIQQLSEYSINGLLVIGGNGSMSGAHALAGEWDSPVIGIPASIDNDIGLTREALGVDTALNTIIEACDRITDTARSHHRAFIVEVMGRHSGYLAMASAVAAAADGVLLPEHQRSRDEVIDAVSDCIIRSFDAARDKNRVLIIKAEGVPVPTYELVQSVTDRLGPAANVEVRGTVLGHLVRGGNPSFRDRLLAGRFGLVAVHAALEGRTDLMTGWNLTELGQPTTDSWIRLFPLADVLAETQSLLEGTSPVTIDRVRRMEAIQGVLAL
ncbi:MAG TPA: 6-phosphofructokinase [Acidimicrobiia bacterium]|nr:6-phosphofructokinase [Acidimicrobiia bacterium]